MDIGENRLHVLLDTRVDDPRTRHVVAVLGCVRNAPALLGDAAFVHEIDDELELMQALEIRDLRLVASLDEGLKAVHDELARAAAEHGLLAKEVSLALLGERGLDAARSQAADRLRVRERQRPRLTGCVLLDGDDRRNPAAGDVLASHEVPGALRGHHGDIDEVGRGNEPESDVESMREEQRIVRLQVRLDGLEVQLLLHRIRREDHDEIGLGRRGRRIDDPKPRLLGLGLALRALAQAHSHIDTRIAQGHRMRMTLAAEAHDRHDAVLDDRQIGVVVVEQFSHGRSSFYPVV